MWNVTEASLNVRMKKTNTVVGAWPIGVKREPKEKGGREEFELLLASNYNGLERYVEWAWGEE
jgi:hypothetical protein